MSLYKNCQMIKVLKHGSIYQCHWNMIKRVWVLLLIRSSITCNISSFLQIRRCLNFITMIKMQLSYRWRFNGWDHWEMSSGNFCIQSRKMINMSINQSHFHSSTSETTISAHYLWETVNRNRFAFWIQAKIWQQSLMNSLSKS